MNRAPLYLTLLLPLAAMAADMDTLIQGSGGQSVGRQAVNQAAGLGNQQANQAVLSTTTAGLAQAAAQTGQAQRVPAGDLAALGKNNYSASISGGSFQGGVGVLQVNQVSGGFNQTLNQFALATGPNASATTTASHVGAVDDSRLAGLTSAAPDSGGSGNEVAGGKRQATMDAASFQNLSGVVQVNQVAGNGNQAGNGIALAVHAP